MGNDTHKRGVRRVHVTEALGHHLGERNIPSKLPRSDI
jgi:hypothetical protein